MVSIAGAARLYVALNEDGRRIGETHHNARIPDTLVDQMREQREEFNLSFTSIAAAFSLPRATVQKICSYQRRAQTADSWRRLTIESMTVRQDHRESTERVRKWRNMRREEEEALRRAIDCDDLRDERRAKREESRLINRESPDHPPKESEHA